MIEAWLVWKRLAPLIGLALIPALIMLGLAKIEARHWHKQSDRFESLYHGEQAAFAQTVANYRAATELARAQDKANADRVKSEQAKINQEQSNEYETRLAAARATAERLRRASQANPGSGGTAPVSGVSAPAGQPHQAAGQDGLSDALTATEQAIQLDELIKWVKRQSEVDPNKP